MASHCLQVKAFNLHWYKINIMDNCNFLETEQANPWHWFWLFRWPNPQTEIKRAGRSFWLESNQIKITSFTFNLCKSISANTQPDGRRTKRRRDTSAAWTRGRFLSKPQKWGRSAQAYNIWLAGGGKQKTKTGKWPVMMCSSHCNLSAHCGSSKNGVCFGMLGDGLESQSEVSILGVLIDFRFMALQKSKCLVKLHQPFTGVITSRF